MKCLPRRRRKKKINLSGVGLPSGQHAPPIRVQILLKSTVFNLQNNVERTKINKVEAVGGLCLKRISRHSYDDRF